VNLISNNGLVQFRDTYNPSYVPLNDGDVGVDGYYSSMLTSLNSKSNVLGSFMGNRLLSKSGLFTYTAGTGQIDWPELDVVIDGEQRTIAAGNIIATSGAHATLVVTAAGTVVERQFYSELIGTDIPLEVHYWTGAAFTTAFDIRWEYNGTSRNVEISCGNSPNCDFGEYELDKACWLAQAFSAVSWEYDAGPSLVRIRGVARAPTTAPYNIQLETGNGLRLEGEGPTMYSAIYSDETNGHTVDLFDCNTASINVKNLSIVHNGNIQADTLGAFKNPGNRSTFENVTITKEFGGTWDVGFANGLIWVNAYSFDLVIDNVRFQACRHSAIMGSGTGTDFMNLGFLTDSEIRNCSVGQGVGQLYGIVANGRGNRIENCKITDSVETYGIIAGGDNVVEDCQIRMTGAVTAGNACVFYRPTPLQVYGRQLKINNCYFWDGEFGVLSYAINDAGWIARVTVRDCDFYQIDKPIDFNDVLAVHGASSTTVDGCSFTDTNEFVAAYENIAKNKFINNTCTTVGGDGVYVRANAGCDIINNNFEGYGSAGSQGHVIAVDLGSPSVQIKDNVIGSTGAPAASIQVDLWRKCAVSGNTIIGSANAATGISCNSWFFFIAVDLPAAVNCMIKDNFIGYQGAAAIHLNRGTAVASVAGGQVIEGNHFIGIPDGGRCVLVDNVSFVDIRGNDFTDCGGSGVRVVGTSAAMGTNVHITENRFNNMAGRTSNSPYNYAVVGIHGTYTHNYVVAMNRFINCGSTTGSAGLNQSVINVDGGDAGQILYNYIDGLVGISSASDQGDYSHGIYVGPGYSDNSQIIGNYVIKNFATTGQCSDKFYGIRCEGANLHITNNRVYFYGTAADTNNPDLVYGLLIGSSHQGMMVGVNYFDVACFVSGITLQRAMFVNNDFSCMVGNYGRGGDMDFTAYNVLIVGNYSGSGGSVVVASSALNYPDTQEPYSNATDDPNGSQRYPMYDVNY
jgi:hypothetical protein